MAGAKIGGRKIKQQKIKRTCDKCSVISEDAIRVKSYSSTGKSTFIWSCPNCLGK